MILIYNAQLIDPAQGTISPGSLIINHDIIDQISDNPFPNLEHFTDAEKIDANNKYLCPGFIDISVGLGNIQPKSFENLSQAAIKGGVTSVIIEPDLSPAIDRPAGCDHILNTGKQYADINLYAYASMITQNHEIAPLGLLKNARAIAYSYGDQAIDNNLLTARCLEYCANHDMIATLHPEDTSLSENGIAHEGFLSSMYGLAPHPIEAEVLGLERDLLLAQKADCKLHIKQISSQQSLQTIQRYKNSQNVNISVSCSLQHISLNENDIIPYRTFLKMRPPLRLEDDRAALAQAVCDGDIDIVTSAHRPCHDDVKRLPYDEAAFGCSTIEHMLPILLRLYHGQNGLNLAQILRCVTINPARRFDLPAGRLEKEAPADLIIFDADQGYKISRDTMQAAATNTPYDDQLVQGIVKKVFVGGKEIS